MLKTIRVLMSLFLLAAAATAQDPPTPQPQPAPVSTPPPFLDEPDHWDIHGPDGSIGIEIRAGFWYGDLTCDVYWLEITGEVNGKPYYSFGIAIDCGDGTEIEVYNGDSGNWTTWEWENDHYKKVGGTSHVRTYHPIY